MTPYVVEVAGLPIALGSDDARWPAALGPRYAPFRTERKPELTLELTTRGDLPDATTLTGLAHERSELTRAGTTLRLHSPSTTVVLDLARRTGWIEAPLHRHGVDQALRLLIAELVPDALLVHGALVADGDRAWICAGPSGAGKSTLATLAGAHACCDELALARWTESGWRAEALPFWHGRPYAGELAGLRLLAHTAPGSGHRLRALGTGEATRRLAPEIVWPAGGGPAAERALALFARLLAEVPPVELAFRRTTDVWKFLAHSVAAEADEAVA